MELRVCAACRKVVPDGASCPTCGAHLTLAPPEYFVGRTFGRYRLERVLGVGGMGAVYVAEHEVLHRRAALKIVLPARRDPSFARRFLREARLLAELSHPNVVEIYDFDVGDWGVPYYVMELLQGETLRTLLGGGGVTLAGAAGLLRDVAAGLAAAHRRGVVHRDLKPDNIFLARYDDRRVGKLLDFGLAKTTAPGAVDSHLTESGLVMGTLHYLAPEQILGAEVGPAADQYALALVVAEVVTGRPVRAGKSMPQIVSTDISSPLDIAGLAPGLPLTISAAVARATDPDPGRRYPDVVSFVEAALADAELLELGASPTHVLTPSGPATREAAPPAPRPPTRRRRLVTFAGLAAAAAAIALVALVPLSRGGSHGAQRIPAPALLQPLASLPAPLDATRILAEDGTTVTLAVSDGLALEPLAGASPPTRVGIDPARVLGADVDGQLLIRDGSRIMLRDLGRGDSTAWTAGLPSDAPVWLSPSGRLAVAAADDGLAVLELADGRYRVRRHLDVDGSLQAVAVGERLLAVVADATLSVFALPGGELRLSRRLDIAQATVVALHDEAGLVAVGGWADHVVVVDVATGTSTAIPHAARDPERLDLLFLPAGPTLALADSGGVRLWRPGRGVIASWSEGTPAVTDVAFLRGQLWALDRHHHRVVELALPGLRVAATVATGARAPWAVVAEPDSGRVLLGGEDGVLFEVDPTRETVRRHELHSLGITSLVADAGHLASASDDTTIAVWRLPDLTVQWRSRAHEFLVNQLLLDHDGESLWSTSSDGSLKRWSWPDLRELETLDTTSLLGRHYGLHAIWRSPDGATMLVGTWEHALLVLARGPDGRWSARAVPVAAPGGYVLAGVPGVRAVVLVGVHPPAGLWVWDRDREALDPLADAGLEARAAVTVAADRVLAFAAGTVLDYRFQRAPDGVLSYRLAIAQHSPLGVPGAACRVGDDRVAVAAEDGRVDLLDLADLSAPTVFSERLTAAEPERATPAPAARSAR